MESALESLKGAAGFDISSVDVPSLCSQLADIESGSDYEIYTSSIRSCANAFPMPLLQPVTTAVGMLLISRYQYHFVVELHNSKARY